MDGPDAAPGISAWYIVPDPWLDPNTDSSGTNEFQWDIGAVLMLDRLGDQTGWMGYGAFPASDLNNRNQLNRGYPECDKIEAPANCQSHRLYGDKEYCDVGYYHHPGSNGWNREFSIDCDMGRGHSGSPTLPLSLHSVMERGRALRRRGDQLARVFLGPGLRPEQMHGERRRSQPRPPHHPLGTRLDQLAERAVPLGARRRRGEAFLSCIPRSTRRRKEGIRLVVDGSPWNASPLLL